MGLLFLESIGNTRQYIRQAVGNTSGDDTTRLLPEAPVKQTCKTTLDAVPPCKIQMPVEIIDRVQGMEKSEQEG